jgi:PKD repeat protein
MKKILLLVLLMSAAHGYSSAQNIVLNPDFEQFSQCPTANGDLQFATSWLDVVYSSDYMNCAFQGWTTQTITGAQSGTGYGGFATYGNGVGAAESFGQFLATPLIAGNSYRMNFFAKKSDSGFYSNVCTGVCIYGFSGNPVAGGAQTNICTGSLPGAMLLGCSDTVVDVLWQSYTINFIAPANLDFIVFTPGCAVNCAEYIYIDNINFIEMINFANVCLGDTTVFTMNDTTSLVSASWSFSDPASGINNTSSLFNPTHVFTSTGTFLVRVIRTYVNTFVDTVIIPVTITACASVNALFQTADSLICPGTCTDFTNLSVNATGYQWTFPGGNPSVSTDVNPAGICYNAPGSYDVQLIATGGVDSDTLLFQGYVTVYPYPPAQGIQQSGDSLIANQGSVSYQWYYNGSLIAGATDYFYIAPQSGDYNVVCTDANGCEVEAVIFNVIAGAQFEVGGLRFEVFPNPVVETLYVISSYLLTGTSVEISVYNMLGERIHLAADRRPMTVDCRLFPPGMYWLSVAAGDKIFHAKFLKQ